jgi:chemotaxis protein MotB
VAKQGRSGAGGARPLIVKRVVEGGHGGHHGGAWKVAYADFVTAMMAFFLLLWLISSASEETLKGLSEYFSDASVNFGAPGGMGGPLHGLDVVPNPNVPAPSSPLNVQPTVPFSPTEEESDSRQVNLADGAEGVDATLSDDAFEAERERREQAAFEAAEQGIREALDATPELRRFQENLAIDQTPEGLRIQILDREKSAMFPVGSDRMYGHTRKLLEVVARAVADLPNRVSLRGHTDSLAFAPGAAYDNWRLSSDRANSTRQAMVELGLGADRVAEVVGKGDAEPLPGDDPHDPRNRRISVVLLHDRSGRPSDGIVE